ncbi:MAG: hypothetical protein ACOCVF_01155 [bacterium]
METKEQILKKVGIDWDKLSHDMPLLASMILRAMENYNLSHLKELDSAIAGKKSEVELMDNMDLKTQIIIENGDVFQGTRDDFMDCFFSNASNKQIIEWCIQHNLNLKIDGKTIL